MGLVEADHIDQQQQQHQEPIFKHFCRVCKRGFACAGALGGHMRSHAVGDVRIHQSSHDQEIGMMSNILRSKPEGESKHSYFLRTNTNRLSSTYRVSEDLRDDKRSFASPAINVERGKFSSSMSSYEPEVDEMMMIKSRRAKSENYDQYQHCASSEEEDLANCLVMLSNKSFVLSDKVEENKAKQVEKAVFQCRACKKVFNSHQALGGHRASHKKVKGCYAARLINNNNLNDDDESNIEEELINRRDGHLVPSDNSSEPGLDLDFSPYRDQLLNTSTTMLSKGKSKGHQCSICQRVFSSGQALGGHKRCHWLTSNLPDNTMIQNLHEFQFDSQQLFKKPMLQKSQPPPLDLNFPPLLNNAADNLNTNSTNPFNYQAPERIFLQLFEKNSGNHQPQNYTESVVRSSLHDLNSANEDEDCRMKQIAKLSDLKDMNLDGGSSSWLQVGIASTTDITATPRSNF